jgi:predicted O-linked N-acetylglucosamine transferase (SPINDLY family)
MADSPETLSIFRQGASLHQAGRVAEAEPLYRQILKIEPDHAETLHLLGLICHQTGRFDEAADLIRRAVSRSPRNPNYVSNLGMALAALGRFDGAIEAYRAALSIRPEAQTWFNFGNALRAKDDLPAAIDAFQNAIALRADFVEALNNLGLSLHDAGRLDEAIATYRRALESGPESAEVLKNLGNAMKDAGELDEAIRCYRRASDLGDDARAAGNLLYAMHFHPRYGPREIYQAHSQWNLRFCRPLASQNLPHANPGAPGRNRPLRIGYVSPDLHAHPVGRFLLPLFAHHDRTQFRIHSYSDLRRADSVTEQLRANTDLWRDTASLSDAQLAQAIRDDAIDILVDVTMHMKGSRLLVFARRPAPVQVTYLAYCSTTGVEAIDYRLTDPFLDPPAVDESQYAEKSVRLPRTYWCYQPHYEDIPVAPPSQNSSSITFGCLNTYSKVNPDVLSAWAAILRNVPGSRLIVHSLPGAHRQRDRALLEREGVDPNRLEFVGFLRGQEYFHQYYYIDVALDPFPYPGGTTTCDALWMGVPVVSLAGQTAVSRAGLSILSNIGLNELIATTAARYIEIASTLAHDVSRLAFLRSTLRDRMRSSPIMDQPRFARDLEAAYRQMWQSFCDTGATSP